VSPSATLRHVFSVGLSDLPHRHRREHACGPACFEPYLNVSEHDPLRLAILATVRHRCWNGAEVEDDFEGGLARMAHKVGRVANLKEELRVLGARTGREACQRRGQPAITL
jgi:hypothetical protein